MGEKNGNGSGLGIVGYDAYEFVVADIDRSRRFYSEMMDLPEVARLDEREAARRGKMRSSSAPVRRSAFV